MTARTLQLVFSAASVCISSAVFVIALNAAVMSGDGTSVDLSRGRGLVLALSVVFLAASTYILIRSLPERSQAAPDGRSAKTDQDQSAVQGDEQTAEAEVDDEHILRTLDADERRLYGMIQDAGGELLQMHVVSTRVFSKAKVTRLLDKLEKRGLVIRERHGMTNRIRIIK